MTSLPIQPEGMIAVAQVLLRANRDVEAVAHGGSMGATIPDGSVIRLRRADPSALRRGDVVAVLARGQLVTHRIIACGRGRRARRYLVTRGDGRTLCDTPVAVADVAGLVTEFRSGARWTAVPALARRPGWRGPAAALLDLLVRVALELDVRLAAAVTRVATRAALAKRDGLGGRP